MSETHHMLLAVALLACTIGLTLRLVGAFLSTDTDPSGRRVLTIEAALLIAMSVVWIGALLSARPWHFSVSGLLVISALPMVVQALRLALKAWRRDHVGV